MNSDSGLIASGETRKGGDDFHLSLEVALAQGFKYAANRRFRHPHARPATRDYMAEQAMEMLSRARFWFTQLTLIMRSARGRCRIREHPEMTRPAVAATAATRRKARSTGMARIPRRPAATPAWSWRGNGKHPFVAEAGRLAVEALKTRHPERFLWIDESGVVSSVGSRAAQAAKDRKHHLWIPPSAGLHLTHALSNSSPTYSCCSTSPNAGRSRTRSSGVPGGSRSMTCHSASPAIAIRLTPRRRSEVCTGRREVTA